MFQVQDPIPSSLSLFLPNRKHLCNSMGPSDDRSQIAFFDVETTVPSKPGQGFALLEFGAILVCPRKLVELHSYSSLVQPSDLSLISSLSVRCNGITPDAVSSAPTFRDIADTVYDILHGRIWAGHNILRFDCARIREAFAEIGHPAPEPKGTIDSLALLTQKFGRRAGDMKMASLATYFGLGKQTHRSLDDVRMNLEVLKYCATVLFLESSLPDVYGDKSWVSPNATTRSRSNAKLSLEGVNLNMKPSSSTLKSELDPTLFPTNEITVENDVILSILTRSTEASNVAVFKTVRPNAFDMSSLNYEVEEKLCQPDVSMEDKPLPESPKMSSTAAVNEDSNRCARFLELDEVSVPCISASLVPFFRGSQKMALLHKDVPLQLCCTGVKVRFGINTKFVNQAGQPKLSFVVDTPPSLCRILDACDDTAQRLSKDSGSSSEWRPVVTRKSGFYNYPTMRLHIPTIVNGDSATYATEMYQKECSGHMQRLLFSSCDASEVDSLLVPGRHVDAYVWLDAYDFQQSAGIRIVAKKLIIH